MRSAHRQQQDLIQTPRRLPNFPQPPVDSLPPLTSLLSHRDAEEDMISNPSDDNVEHPPALPFTTASRPSSSRRPLPDPAISHSRHPSNNLIPTPFQIPMPIPIQAPVPKRTDVLNPNAKPFVFASGNRRSGSFSQLAHGPQMSLQPQHQQQPHISQPPPVFGHARGASFGRPLNVGAPEFKPGTFTFTPPPNVPKFPMLQPQTAVPARCSPPPLTNVDTGPMHTQQGREKRQRRGSVNSAASEISDDGKGVMTSFKFPQESPLQRIESPSPPQRRGTPSPAPRPFALPDLGGINIGAIMESAPHAETPVSEGLLDGEADGEGDDDADAEGDGEDSVDEEHALPVPLSMRARRAPIPLD